jgi:hypothetical protein
LQCDSEIGPPNHAFILYPDRPFGSKNKNIITYSLAAMLYTELELKRKVDWQMVLTKNKEDRMEYAERDVPDNYSTFHQSVEVGLVLVVHVAN